MSHGKTRTLREAAIEVLKKSTPTHYQELTTRILDSNLASTSSKTPAASLNAAIHLDIKRKGSNSDFVRISPGVYGLRGLHSGMATYDPDASGDNPPQSVDGAHPSGEETEQLVRISQFPVYREVRQLLRIWHERQRKQITGFQNALQQLRGTPQQTVDWTNPDRWISERLSGEHRELADAIWAETNKTVNPRYTYGHWLLSQTYGLTGVHSDGTIYVTNRGRGFLEHEGGDVEALLDEQEGLTRVLALVADNGPVPARGILSEWTEYLRKHSNFSTQSGFKYTLGRRLNNLIDRDLVSRKSTMYSVTDAGLSYLKRVGTEEALGGAEQQEIWELAKKQELSVRENLLELLFEMDPFVFEHLVKRLLEEMDYQNVEVTARSGDGGVDVVGDIELGITSVREVVQAKRHKQKIQRKDLDALRGSLYRFNAVRGTIISTSQFSKGTQEAAFAGGAAPITLIDGEKLVDLLIERNIGVRKRPLEILEVDADAFAGIGSEVD